MRCLVTGGAGFIGSHIVDALIKDGHTVRLLDNLSSGNLANFAHHNTLLEFIRGDIRDFQTTLAVCKDIDVVFHEAAIASVSQSMDDPVGTYEVNVTGTANMLEAAGQQGVKHFIFASTAAIYGYPKADQCVETHLPNPLSRYGMGKLLGEECARFYADYFNMQVTCFRYFNVFGQRQSAKSDYAGVISIFIDTLLSKQTPKIYGDGEQTRDFIHVTDIARANLLALQNTGNYHYEILNLGCMKRTSINLLLESLKHILKSPLEANYHPERRGDIRHSMSDAKKAESILGFTATTTLEDGLTQLMEYIIQQRQNNFGMLEQLHTSNLLHLGKKAS